MKTVQNSAAEAAKTRDSANKDLVPIISLDEDAIVTLAYIHEMFPYDKEKVCRAIIKCTGDDQIIGTLGFRISYVDKKIKSKFIRKGGSK
jgi:hypothetical protein